MTPWRTAPVAENTGTWLDVLRARLVPAMLGSRLWGWAGPLLVTAFGAFLRFNRLGVPRAVIFDETYYVPDAYGILRYGVEHNYIANRNTLIVKGDPHFFTGGASFVVHPPFGKILIAVGEWLFGLTPFGWRFAVAVVGSLSILILARIARRMTRSTLLGCVAGLLLALDGLEFVMSRTALLDIFVMFWVLAAFGCLVVDRDTYRGKLAAARGTELAGRIVSYYDAVERDRVPGLVASLHDGVLLITDAAMPVASDPARRLMSAAAEAGIAVRVLPRPPATTAAQPLSRLPTGGRGFEDLPPRQGIRWWRVGAGVCLGLACASKWNGIWFIPAFGAMCIAWDVGARRAAGFRGATGAETARDLGGLAGSFLAVPLIAYLATWAGWFAASSNAHDQNYRNWAAQHGVHIPVLSDLISLFEYHVAMLHFNTTLTTPHPYQSKPWTWLLMTRPVSYYWVCTAPSGKTCPSGTIPRGSTAQEVLALGTPVIWWTSILALLVCLVWWLTRRDWRAGAALVGVTAGWLPWFAFADRTQFYFYSVVFVPFLVLAITLCLGLVIGPARAPAARRAVGASLAGAYLLGVLLDFAYMYPVFAAKALPYASWYHRMWYHPGGHGWI